MKRLFLLFFLLPNLSNSQTITTYACSGISGFYGDGLPATNAKIGAVASIAIDRVGNLYILDGNNQRIRKVDKISGLITTIAGNGTPGFSGDGNPATDAQINSATGGGIAVDDTGNIYLADEYNFRIRKISKATGIITTIAGSGMQHHYGDGGPASAASFGSTNWVTVDLMNNIFICDSSGWIRKISTSGIITTVAGTGLYGNTGDGGPATAAQIVCGNMAFDMHGNLYFTDPVHGIIRKINYTTGIITTIAGNGSTVYTNGVPATTTGIVADYLGIDRFNQLYLSEEEIGEYKIRKIDSFGIINVAAGTGVGGFSGDNGPATAAKLHNPAGIAFDSSGNLFFADQSNARIRKITFPSVTTKINQIDKYSQDINIYPNPTCNQLSFTSTNKISRITITNLIGQIVFNNAYDHTEEQLNISSFPPGIYFVKITDIEGLQTVKKIIKE